MIISKSRIVNLIGIFCLQTLQAIVMCTPIAIETKIVNQLKRLELYVLQAIVNRKSKIVTQYA